MQNWKRYLDQCLILWSESEEDLEKFKDIINNIHCDIQFTYESSNKEIPFLDILIKKEGTITETDIYYNTFYLIHVIQNMYQQMFHIIWPKGYAELPAKKKLKRRDWKNFLTFQFLTNLIKMEFPEQNKKGKKYLKNQVKLTKGTLNHLLQHIIPEIQTFSQ